MPPSVAATRIIRDWSRAALSVEAGAGAGTIRVDGLDVDDVLAAIARQRVVELLDSHGAALGLPPEILVPLAESRLADGRRLAVQVLELARLDDGLRRIGVPFMLIKGAALAVATTGDPGARGRGDLDVLVSEDSVLATHRLLEDLGWTVRRFGSGVPGSWAWRHVIRTFHEMTYDGPDSTVDLHWRLDPTQGALPAFDELWARRSTVDIAGIRVHTLGPRDAFSHACHHAARDDWRWLRSLVDVHRLARLPEVWSDGPLRRVDLATLRVTRDCLGLPASVPDAARARIDRVPARGVRRALVAQERPVYADYPFPAAQTLREVRYRVAASPGAVDLGRTATAAFLPAKSVAGLEDATGWTAVPRVFARRARWLGRRVSAWVRREPYAAVNESRPRRP